MGGSGRQRSEAGPCGEQDGVLVGARGSPSSAWRGRPLVGGRAEGGGNTPPNAPSLSMGCLLRSLDSGDSGPGDGGKERGARDFVLAIHLCGVTGCSEYTRLLKKINRRERRRGSGEGEAYHLQDSFLMAKGTSPSGVFPHC